MDLRRLLYLSGCLSLAVTLHLAAYASVQKSSELDKRKTLERPIRSYAWKQLCTGQCLPPD